MARIDAFFRLMNSQGASDLHMMAGSPPCLRVRGDIEPVKYHELSHDELMEMLFEITPEHKLKTFEETGDIDFAYELEGMSRYRANFFRQSHGVGAVFRQILLLEEPLVLFRRCSVVTPGTRRDLQTWSKLTCCDG